MPDSLDVAHQRKLIETLQRDGHSTYEAEIRLRTMLDFLTSIRGYQAGAVERPSKERRDRQASSEASWPSM
jgi:hypothetical protein